MDAELQWRGEEWFQTSLVNKLCKQDLVCYSGLVWANVISHFLRREAQSDLNLRLLQQITKLGAVTNAFLTRATKAEWRSKHFVFKDEFRPRLASEGEPLSLFLPTQSQAWESYWAERLFKDLKFAQQGWCWPSVLINGSSPEATRKMEPAICPFPFFSLSEALP